MEKPFDGIKSAADILSKMNNQDSQAILDSLTTSHPRLAKELKNKLFTFEDSLIKTDNFVIQRLLQLANANTLKTALRNASPALRQRFYDNLSEKAAECLQKHLDNPDEKESPENVAEAQKCLLETARPLLLSTDKLTK